MTARRARRDESNRVESNRRASLAFFGVGASRSLGTRRSWVVNGVELLAIGMLAAAVAYVAGALPQGLA